MSIIWGHEQAVRGVQDMVAVEMIDKYTLAYIPCLGGG